MTASNDITYYTENVQTTMKQVFATSAGVSVDKVALTVTAASVNIKCESTRNALRPQTHTQRLSSTSLTPTL